MAFDATGYRDDQKLHAAVCTHRDEFGRINWKALGRTTGWPSEVARSRWKRIRHTLPDTPAPPTERIDPLVLEQERIEQRRTLREDKELLTAVAGERSLRAFLEGVVRDVVVPLKPAPPVKVALHPEASVETHVLNWSDWHAYETVLASRTRGFGEYNSTIFGQRVRHIVRTQLDIKTRLERGKGWYFPRLVVAANGDFVSGTIHELERHSDSPNIVASVYACARVMAQGLRDLRAHYPEVTVYGTSGNHGRFPDARRMQQKDPTRNWDTVVYLFAQEMTRDCDITWHIPDSYAVSYDVEGWTFLQSHGHDVRSWNCFPPGTRVTLDDGRPWPIEDVTSGMRVVTGSGGDELVLDTWRYDYDGPLTNLVCYGMPPLRLTPNHQIAVVFSQQPLDTTPTYVPAGHVSPGDYLFIPKPRWDESITHHETPPSRHYRDTKIPERVPVTPALGYIIGQYLGDGSTTIFRGKAGTSSALEMAYHEDETDYWVRFMECWEETFGYRPCLLRRPELRAVRARRVQVNGRRAVEFIRELAGHGAATKRLHGHVMLWPVDALRELLIGYLRADGHTARARYHAKYTTHRVAATTVSTDLGWQLYWIARKCGYTPSLKVRRHGRRDQVVLQFYGDDARELGPLTQRDFHPEDDDTVRPSRRRMIARDDGVLVRVGKAGQEPYVGSVYDLHIVEQNTYTANLAAVHNSIPHYGINRMVSNLNALEASRGGLINYFLFAHFHEFTMKEHPGGEWYINGSLIGANEFSVQGMGKAGVPKQVLLGVHPKHGVTAPWGLVAQPTADAEGYDARPGW